MSLAAEPARALVAVDLGAESCRVSLLQWRDGQPVITLVHRFANAPRQSDGGLRWDLGMIVDGVQHGLRLAAELAPEGVGSLAVDGWAVDYVRLGPDGTALADPFCYRDERTLAAEESLHARMSPARFHEVTGVQLLRINTVYQLHADRLAGHPPEPWLNLPEYLLARWGGRRVAEYTNATHTQMVELSKGCWAAEIVEAALLDPTQAPEIVPPGTIVGRLRGPLAELPALRDVTLIAPACHDTAAAIAGIPAHGDDWVYISSGTWSLVGTLLARPQNSPATRADNFTNLGAVGGLTCFHKNVNGMWLIRQCMDRWAHEGTTWRIEDLVAAARDVPAMTNLLDVDDPDLLLAGYMPSRINAQRERNGLAPLDEDAANAPAFAALIFRSLAARYADVLARISLHTGKTFRRLFIVGGGSQNEFLNQLTREATGLEVYRGSAESSTLGNFAVQLAVLERKGSVPSAESVSRWAARLAAN